MRGRTLCFDYFASASWFPQCNLGMRHILLADAPLAIPIRFDPSLPLPSLNLVHTFTSMHSSALSELGLTQVNTIVLAFPSSPPSELTLDHMTPIWKEVETFFHKGVAKEVGVADLDRDRLEELYNWAALKPKVNQVNVAHCCTIPEVRSSIQWNLQTIMSMDTLICS